MLGRTTLRRAAGAALTAALICSAGASTASAVVPGGLVAASCVAAKTTGCTTVANLAASSDLAVSPDGKNLYALTSVALLTFDRNAASGALTFKDCIRATAVGGCRGLPAKPNLTLNTPTALAITPDGHTVYVANGIASGSIVELNRAGDGTLAVKTDTPCIANAGAPPPETCNDAKALAAPQDLAIADNKLYATGSSAVTVLEIGGGGSLSQAPDSGTFAGCVSQVLTADGCADGRGLTGAQRLAVAGDRLYVSTSGKSIAAIIRDPTTGLLRMTNAATACVNATGGECTAQTDLSKAGAINDIALGAGGELYAALTTVTDGNTPRVVTFDRTANGLARRAGPTGCVHNGAATSDCSFGRGLGTPTQLAPSADGADVYVTAGASGGVVELNRAGNGTLTMRTDVRGCLAPPTISGCTSVSTLSTPTGVAMTPDGRFVYASTSASSGQISALKRDSSGPVCTPVSTTVNAGDVATLIFPCSDPDGDKLAYQTITPPTLGTLGLLDNNAGTIVYASPQGQNGTTTYAFRASYASTTFGAFPTDGTIGIAVVGAPSPVPQGIVGIDNDHDGFFAGQDCNDNNPSIRPGAKEIKGNRTDENCDGTADPFPTVSSGVLHNWDFTKSGRFTLTALKITQSFPKGMAVRIKCSGKKCPFKSKKLKLAKVKKGASNVLGSLKGKQRKFRAGQTLDVLVSAPKFNTKVARIKLKKGKQPSIQPLCVVAGETKVRKRCS
jgi:DNA-binding beta-propeller fold protein YncE